MIRTLGSLCSGIGGLDLGLERATGATTLFQVEINPYARSVLKRHWPDAIRLADIHDVGAHNLPRVDCLSAGFPCQPHSMAGKRGGRSDQRWIFPEVMRVVRELEPDYVVFENVPGLLTSDQGGRSVKSCGRWRSTGTMRSGVFSELTMWTPRTGESASSSLDGDGAWATPAASVPNEGEGAAKWLARFVKHSTKKTGATRAGMPLTIQVQLDWATLLAADAKAVKTAGGRRTPLLTAQVKAESPGALNATWVEQLMGFPDEWTVPDGPYVGDRRSTRGKPLVSSKSRASAASSDSAPSATPSSPRKRKRSA